MFRKNQVTPDELGVAFKYLDALRKNHGLDICFVEREHLVPALGWGVRKAQYATGLWMKTEERVGTDSVAERVRQALAGWEWFYGKRRDLGEL